MAFKNKLNLENVQTNLNPFLIGFASCVSSITIDILQVVDVIGGRDLSGWKC
jgi:hypothetical protein